MSARTLAAVAAAAVVVLAGCAVLTSARAGGAYIGDDANYQPYADQMVHGSVPYRDFFMPYPPGALPAFILPYYHLGLPGSTRNAVLTHPPNASARRYTHSFAFLMVACLALVTVCTVASLAAIGVSTARLLAGTGLIAISPLLFGTLVFTHFDPWPASLTAAAAVALLYDRFVLAGAVLGAAVAVKLYPALLIPLAVAYAWKRRGRRASLVMLGAAVAVAAAVFVPFFVIAPHGLWSSVRDQAGRALQAESLGSSVLVAVHALTLQLHLHGLLPVHPFPREGLQSGTLGSVELHGPAADVVLVISTLLTFAALIALWIGFARGAATRERLVRFFAAALAAQLALGRVLSPQLVIWLLPLVVLVPRRRGTAAIALFLTAAVITHIWFPGLWRSYINNELKPVPTFLLLLRNLVLVALFLTLALPHRRWLRGR